LVVLVVGLINPSPPLNPADPQPAAAKQSAPRKSVLDLPPPDQYPPLTPDERRRLTKQLAEIAERAGAWPIELQAECVTMAIANGHTPMLPATAILIGTDITPAVLGPERLLELLDQRLGAPKAGRDPGRLRDHGPLQRQLRALLWKHGVADYNDPRLNSSELAERLEPLVPRP
jgi:hypothetical protein